MGIHYGKADFINYGKPSLLLDFARNKSLVDRISGNNLITFERASTGTYVGADGLIKTAAADEPRFDHNPDTLESLGLLVEGSRTNKRTSSEAFNFWAQTNVVTTANTTISPDGQQTADEVYATSNGVNTGYVGGGASSFNQNEWHTFSIFWKAGTSNGFNLQLPWSDPNNAGVVCLFRLVNGELVASPPGGYGNFELASTPTTVTKYPNDWWRVSLTFRPTGVPSGSVLSIWIYPSYDTNNLRTTDLTSYFWGAQAEEGSLPTSYIPTSGSTVTRSYERAQILGSSLNSFLRQGEGSVICSGVVNVLNTGTTKYQNWWTLDQSNSVNRIWLYARGGGEKNEFIGGDGSTQFSINSLSNTVANQKYKLSCAYKQNDFVFCENGTVIGSDLSGDVPNVTHFGIGSRNDIQHLALNGTISNLSYYPTRLTNAQLQELTQ